MPKAKSRKQEIEERLAELAAVLVGPGDPELLAEDKALKEELNLLDTPEKGYLGPEVEA